MGNDKSQRDSYRWLLRRLFVDNAPDRTSDHVFHPDPEELIRALRTTFNSGVLPGPPKEETNDNESGDTREVMGTGDDDTLHTTQHTRIAVTIEPEAAHMLDKLVSRLYPDKRTSQARAEVIEQGIRTIYRHTFGHTSPTA